MIDRPKLNILKTLLIDNPGAVNFPLIADMYLNINNYKEAGNICRKGLKHYINHPDGLFILAKNEIKKNNYKTGEKLLKTLLETNYIYPEALQLLAQVQIKLKRAKNTVKAVHKKYEKFNYVAQTQLKNKEHNKKKEKKVELTAQSTDLKPLNISPLLATFTLTTILENQGLYSQALDVLNMIDDKNNDKKKLENYKKRILKKFHHEK